MANSVSGGRPYASTGIKLSRNVIGCCKVIFLYIFFIIHSCQIVFFIDFRSGKAPILVATDVAARGLGKSSFGLP